MVDPFQTNGIFNKATFDKDRWTIVHIEGPQVIISKKKFIFSLKIDFVLVNSADTDEMPLHAAFHLGLCCLPKYPFRGFRSTKGQSDMKLVYKACGMKTTVESLCILHA